MNDKKNDDISSNIKEIIPSEELISALKEAEYMENHPEEYKSFHSVGELMEDLNKDDSERCLSKEDISNNTEKSANDIID